MIYYSLADDHITTILDMGIEHISEGVTSHTTGLAQNYVNHIKFKPHKTKLCKPKEKTKVFILEDLDCAHCAAKIEKAVGELEGVSSSNCTFLTQKLTVEVDDDKAAGLFKQIKKALVGKKEA